MNIRQIFGLLAAIACAGSVQAQRVGWEADFKTRFDNREFTGSSCNESQTIFLADLSTAVSYNWLDRNTLRFGVQMQKDFGDNRDYFSEVRPLASYAYRAERLGADVGIFSRDELRGDYSHAFFNDSLRVYDPTIQGMAVRYRNPKGLRAELVLNWEGMYSEYSREKFRIFGAIHKDWSREADKRWYVGGGLSMFHFANSALTEGNVVDNMLANPYVGFASKAAEVVRRNADGRPTVERPFWYDFRAGFLWAPQRDRIADEGWKAPMGGELRVRLGWKGLEFEIREQPLCRRESHAALRPLRIGALRRRTVVRHARPHLQPHAAGLRAVVRERDDPRAGGHDLPHRRHGALHAAGGAGERTAGKDALRPAKSPAEITAAGIFD